MTADTITIANSIIIYSLSPLEAARFKVSCYPRILCWMDAIQTNVPFNDKVAREGIEALTEMAREKLNYH